jgi:hypothetical protein
MDVKAGSTACSMRVGRSHVRILMTWVCLCAGIGSAHAQVPGDARDMKLGEMGRIEKTLLSVVPQGGTIDVHVHVIISGQGVANGDIPDSQIADQIAVLNTGFASTGWTFNHVSTERVVNATWFSMTSGSDAERAAKMAMRRGTAKDLNIYTAAPGSGSLGYASWPWDYASDPILDGIVLLYSSLPGGTAVPYNLGVTASHLVGHWVGLYHTFEGACQKSGDFVADTPAEQAAAFGCPIARDSCTRDGGEDPVHNFMDFTDDFCKSGFSPGQIDRIHRLLATYRIF